MNTDVSLFSYKSAGHIKDFFFFFFFDIKDWSTCSGACDFRAPCYIYMLTGRDISGDV